VARLERRPGRKKLRRKIPADDVLTAEEAAITVTYYVALPFIRTDDGTAPGEAQECQSEAAAIRRPEGMSRDPSNAGAVAFKRAGDPNVGERCDHSLNRLISSTPVRSPQHTAVSDGQPPQNPFLHRMSRRSKSASAGRTIPRITAAIMQSVPISVPISVPERLSN
jgi:hypothetical protein